MIPLLIITGLILVNALFVAAEFALIGVPRAAVERRARAGHRVAKLIARLLHDPRLQDQYIATAQLGITFASLGLGMYGEHVLAEWVASWFRLFWPENVVAEHTIASIIALVILTYFHIVIGEMVPKAVALQSAERTALWITPPMTWIRRLLFPLVLGLNAIGNRLLRAIGIERSEGHQHYHTPEELEFVIQESQEGGALRAEASQVLKELLRFGELSAGEVMTPRINVVGIPLGSNKDDVAEIVGEYRHVRYPVYEEDLDHIIGSVHIKDLLPVLMDGEVLDRKHTRAVAFVPETAKLDNALAAMSKAHTQMAVVMDEYGGTAGMVTTQDLFDEVVGRVTEDIADAEIQQHDDVLIVAGTVRLDEVGERLDLELEHEEVDTVSGLILLCLGRPPEKGDSVVYQGVRFEVSEVAGHGVGRCIVSREPIPEEDAEREESERNGH